MSMDQDRDLLRRAFGPDGPEVGCDECFDLLDRYAELAAAGREPAAEMPAMRAHLDGCPACREDFESLRDLLTQG